MTAVAAFPAELEGDVLLPNDRRIHVRPLRRGDDGPVRELYRHLSPRTRYLRFFSAPPALSDAVLRLLTCVDYRRRLALVAELDTADGAGVVALGSYGAVDEGSAEVGLVVRDEWQRQGIGTALASEVLRAAEARGFRQFVAHVASDNTGIRRLLRRVGQIVSSTTSQGVSEISFVPKSRD